MTCSILGIGTALPASKIHQPDAAEFAIDRCCQDDRQAKLLRGLYRRSRVQQRAAVVLGPGNGDAAAFLPTAQDADDRGPTTAQRMQRYAREAVPLAARACKTAIERAGCPTDQLTHIVTATCTGFTAPGLDIRLIRMLGLRPSVIRTNVGFMGCHGAFNALAVGRSITNANPDARVLVCATELCSLHFAYGFEPQSIVSNALFADGAGALVLSGQKEDHDDGWQLMDTGSYVLPDCDDAMTWDIGNHGFKMSLSPRVPGLIQEHLRKWLEPWLASHELGLDEIGAWAIHPGGPRVIELVESALGLPDQTADISRDVLRNHGNMSSATIVFILDRLCQADVKDPILAIGFGPGLASEVLLLNRKSR